MGQESVCGSDGPGCDFSDVLRAVLAEVRPTAESRSISLQVEQQSQSIRLKTDRSSAIDLFRTLLMKTLACCGGSGSVEVLIQQNADWAVVQVGLSGLVHGPHPDHSTEPGAGAALHSALREFERFGGIITGQVAVSEPPARFIVSLPSAAAATSKPDTKKPISPSKQALRILVVDDNAASARLLARMLGRIWGHTVEEAHSGKAALSAVPRFQPAVVFLDIGLPDLSGHEVARQLRETEHGKELVLVALTGYGLDEDRNRSFEAGFDEHLLKPASAELLERVLSHPRLAGVARERGSGE